MSVKQISEDAKRALTAGLMFRGSRDFLLAWELLGLHRQAPEARAGRAPKPLQSWVTCASLSLELALKSRIVLDGKKPPNVHDYGKLFRVLSHDVQSEIASAFQVNGKQATIADLLAILATFEGTFVDWRYLHERLGDLKETVFHEGNMIAMIRAVHASIALLRPDFAPWPGVIVDAP